MAVWDSGTRRASVLAADGSFARSFRLESSQEVPSVQLLGFFDDASVLALGYVRGVVGPPDGRLRDPRSVYRYDAGGDLLGEVGTSSGGEAFFMPVNGDGFAYGPTLFVRQARHRAAGTLLLEAENDTWELRFRDPDGTLRRIVRRDVAPVPITEDMRAEAVAAVMRRSNDTELLRRALRDQPVPETAPAYDEVFVDGMGRVWVQGYDHTEPPVRSWEVFDPAGRLLARTSVPAAFSLHDAGRDWVLGVIPDELDVEHAVLARLVVP